MGNLDQISFCETNQDAKTVMRMQNKLCDCHLRQKDMFAKMLTRQPSGAKSDNGRGFSTYDDVMSKGSVLDQELYFRQFRSPCRKTCSTIHNPAFHRAGKPDPLRYGPPIKGVREPERPESADNAWRRFNWMHLDWFNSDIYLYIHHARLDPTIKLNKTMPDA